MRTNHGDHSWCYMCIAASIRSCKSKRHNDWFRSSAKAMDLILDDSLYPSLIMTLY